VNDVGPHVGPLVVAAVAAAVLVIAMVAAGIAFAVFLKNESREGAGETPNESAARGATREREAHGLFAASETAATARAGVLSRLGFSSVEPIPDETVADGIAKGASALAASGPATGGGRRLVVFLAPSGGAVPSAVVDRVAAHLPAPADGRATGAYATATVLSADAFTREAWQAASRAPIELVDGKQLAGLLASFQGR